MCTPCIAQDSGMNEIVLPLPDDFHNHFRDDPSLTSLVAGHVKQRFGRCLAMPNLAPPVTTAAAAHSYHQRLLSSGLEDGSVDLVMTLYLTDTTTPKDIVECCPDGISVKSGAIRAAKLYPAGATTNSAHGVKNVAGLYPTFRAMEETGMVLCIHSEVPDSDVDIFDREAVFIERIMVPLAKEFTKLKIVMEHISTEGAVKWVSKAPPNFAASITVHHLLYNRNSLLAGGIRPHFYCLPILKRETHRVALLKAATSGDPRFFAGTDSAPHLAFRKETECGCAGVYTAHIAVELYAEAFDQAGALDKLKGFLCEHGADHYGMERNETRCPDERVVLKRSRVGVPKVFNVDGLPLKPLRAGEEVAWSLVREGP